MKNPPEYYRHTDEDLQILQKIDAFLPERIFDVHAHLYSVDVQPDTVPINEAYGTVGADRFAEDTKLIYGIRKVQGLFLP